MISVSSAEVDFYLKSIEEVIERFNSIDYSIDLSEHHWKTPQCCVKESSAQLGCCIRLFKISRNTKRFSFIFLPTFIGV